MALVSVRAFIWSALAIVYAAVGGPRALASQGPVVRVILKNATTGVVVPASSESRHVQCSIAGIPGSVSVTPGSEAIECRWSRQHKGELQIRFGGSDAYYPESLDGLSSSAGTIELLLTARFTVSGTVSLDSQLYAQDGHGFATVRCRFVHDTPFESEYSATKGAYVCRDPGSDRTTLREVSITAVSSVAREWSQVIDASTLACAGNACRDSATVNVDLRLGVVVVSAAWRAPLFAFTGRPRPDATQLRGTLGYDFSVLSGLAQEQHENVSAIGGGFILEPSSAAPRIILRAGYFLTSDTTVAGDHIHRYHASIGVLPTARLFHRNAYVMDVAPQVSVGAFVTAVPGGITKAAPFVSLGIRVQHDVGGDPSARFSFYGAAGYNRVLRPQASIEPLSFVSVSLGVDFRLSFSRR